MTDVSAARLEAVIPRCGVEDIVFDDTTVSVVRDERCWRNCLLNLVRRQGFRSMKHALAGHIDG